MFKSSPFQVLLPRNLWGRKTTARQYPENCKYKISIAKPLLIKAGDSIFSLQSFEGADYYLQLWSFNLSGKGKIQLNVEHQFIGLLLCIVGSYTETILEQWTVKDKKYLLCFYPKGEYEIGLTKGDTVILWIIPPMVYLLSMAVEHPGVKHIYNNYLFGSKQKKALPICNISHSVLRIIKLLVDSKEQAASLDHILRVYILHLLSLYNKDLRLIEGGKEYKRNKQGKKIEQVLKYIQEHITDEKSIQPITIATAFSIGIEDLRKGFKRLTGKTIQHYIRDERLMLAKKTLLESELPVSDVAMLVGYTATSNFIRAYKKMFGHPPGDER